MNILHISTADNSGGAAKAAFRLIGGLNNAGITNRMLVGVKVEKANDTIDFTRPNKNFYDKLKILLVKQIENRTGLQYLIQPWRKGIVRHPFYRQADVVHLHNIHSDFFPMDLVKRIGKEKPIVWTFHDMWPMTGHCAFPEMVNCEQWITGCKRCAYLREYPAIGIDTVKYLFNKKTNFFGTDIIKKIIAPSKWMARQAQRSLIFKNHCIEHIPYGVDTSIFKPGNRSAFRQHFDIQEHETVIFFSALDLGYDRKGGKYLLNAINQIEKDFFKNHPTVLLCTGDESKDFQLTNSPMRFLSLGMVNNDRIMSMALNMADIYVHPAISDNLPNAILESMACKTPVIGFDQGGIPDMVRHLKTGYLAKNKDAADLSLGLRMLIENPSLRKNLGDQSFQMILENYSIAKQTESLIAIYKGLMESK